LSAPQIEIQSASPQAQSPASEDELEEPGDSSAETAVFAERRPEDDFTELEGQEMLCSSALFVFHLEERKRRSWK